MKKEEEKFTFSLVNEKEKGLKLYRSICNDDCCKEKKEIDIKKSNNQLQKK